MHSHEVQMEINGKPVAVHFDHTHAEPSNGIGESYDITAVMFKGVDILDFFGDDKVAEIEAELEKRRAA